MESDSLARLHIASTVTSRLLAILAVVVTGLILVGWFFDVFWLKHLINGHPSISANIAFLIFCAAMSALLTTTVHKATYRAGVVMAASVAIIGALACIQYLFSISVPLDFEICQPNPSSRPITFPGPISFFEGPMLLLISGSILLLSSKRKIYQVIGQILILLTLVPSIQALSGHFFAVPDLVIFCTPTECARMTLIGAILFFALSCSVFTSTPKVALMKHLTSNRLKGLLLRGGICATILLWLLAGWLKMTLTEK